LTSNNTDSKSLKNDNNSIEEEDKLTNKSKKQPIVPNAKKRKATTLKYKSEVPPISQKRRKINNKTPQVQTGRKELLSQFKYV